MHSFLHSENERLTAYGHKVECKTAEMVERSAVSVTRDIKAQAKRMFAGANTSTGFRSFYNFLIGSEAHRLIVLKGGPGVGKSTFIRHVADALIKSGYLVELFHCSSDPNSLDQNQAVN